MSDAPSTDTVTSSGAASYPGADFDKIWQSALKPDDYQNPKPQEKYHLAIVGAGPAGLITAIGAAGLGAKVALIERHTMGGDCLNVGCVPSKCLLDYSKKHPGDFDGAFAWLREVRAGIAPHDSVTRYTELGVDVFMGDAAFTDDGTLSVDGTQIKARRYAMCTGASALVPPIPGLRESNPLTNESVFELREKLNSIAILGAGPIGCELAQAFARLGVEVHLFEMADRVLGPESPRASAIIGEALVAAGVHVHLGSGVESAIADGNGVVIKNGKGEYRTDRVLVALGRRPNTADLNLAAANVEMDERGLIKVDEKLRSSNSAVFAAGDCTAKLQFTHHADAQARVVVQNALFAPTATVTGFVVPHSTYTTPEVASVGESEASLAESGTEYDTYEVAFNELDRGRAEADNTGYAQVFCAKGSDQILGASIVGHDAGEQLAPLCLMMSNKLGLGAAAKTILAYPTRSEYLKRLGDAYNRTRFTPLAQRITKFWFKLTA